MLPISPTSTSRRRAAALLVGVALVTAGILPASRAEAATSPANGRGLQVGARIVTVSTLADKGPGSLRAALDQRGPRIVVFSVGGYIELESDLIIQSGQVTVAGETAPGTGIVLRGGSLKVRTGQVELRNIAVYAGSTNDPKIAENRDSISVYGSPSRKNVIRDVVLSHVTAGWGVDENMDLQGLVDGVRVEHSFFVQGLRNGGHPKGVHSMNLLLGNPVQRAEILGNIFAGSEQRSPRLTNGNRAAVINNFIYGYGRASTHIDRSKTILNPGAIDVVGNVYQATGDSTCKQPIVQMSKDFFDGGPRTDVHLADNRAIGDDAGCIDAAKAPIPAGLSDAPVRPVDDWRTRASAYVYPAILDQAGARPGARNPIDARAIAGIRAGTLRIIGTEADAGGYPRIEPTSRPVDAPVEGRIAGEGDLKRLAGWLCDEQKAVGGVSSACR
ncbi:hypothetical protein [Aureimonas sp. AU12]|uniref:hypothetical protein n=1 Tax=Aureimonas sp. AU12 TaxID=1638161 RepID=UPI00078391B7|nr:hypothetical protein [Aureimonas sp. AU12]